MAWTTPTSRSTGNLITASIWNTDLVDNLNILKTSIANDGRLSGEIKNFREEITTVTISAGTATFDLSLSNTFKCSLTANITTFTVSNWTASKTATVSIRLTQDATGSRTVALPAGWRWAGGTAPTITGTANKADILILYSDDGGTTIFPALYTQNA